MITYVDDPRSVSSDYALMKMLTMLLLHTESESARRLDAICEFHNMEPGEILYIVGHGVQVSGEIRDLPSNRLLLWLNDENKGFPDEAGGIFIMTCYSGNMYGSDSLVNRIATGLRHPIPVTGAVGFAYGSPVTMETGLPSVLPADLTAVYGGRERNDVNGVITQLLNYRGRTNFDPPLADGIVEKLLRREPNQTQWNELWFWADRFIQRRNDIENKMMRLVQKAMLSEPNEVAKILNNKDEWGTLIQRQYELFTEANLFLEGLEGVVSEGRGVELRVRS
ncbi:MAG: hypothetical protein OEU26_24835 [Candidatus Tectomicrobia bacterium]|nr:hypothetical protein [Candidatus Tectomicrobia bacterium]